MKTVEEAGVRGLNKLSFLIVSCIIAAAALIISAVSVASAEEKLPEGYDPAGREGMLFNEKYEGEKNPKTTLSYRINSLIELSTGSSKGAFMIENPTRNSVDMTVKIIYRGGEEEYLIYESGLLPPSSHIMYDTLDVDLQQGEYPCYAVITGFDPETGVELGHIECDLTVLINS